MYSRVGVPARMFSIWNVICFSISTGVSAGAMALICTWLLVTSGTASIGSLVERPDAEGAGDGGQQHDEPAVTGPKGRGFSRSSLVRLCFSEIGLQDKRVEHGDDLARLEAAPVTSTASSVMAPACTARASNPSGTCTNAVGFPSTVWIELLGSSSATARRSTGMLAPTKDPGRQRPSALSSDAMTRVVLVSLLTIGLMKTILPTAVCARPSPRS